MVSLPGISAPRGLSKPRPLFLLFFVTYCFPNKRKGGAEKPVPNMIFLVASRPLASSRKGQGDVENVLVPSP